MASRTKQKEEARARRLAEERAAAERARQQRRFQMIGGIVLAAIAVVVVLIVISSGGGSSSKPPSNLASTKAQRQVAGVNSLLAGIPQSANRLGSPSAKVTVTEYGDLQCPICRDFALGPEETLISHDVRAGKAQLIYKSLSTATGNGPNPNMFTPQQAAAYAAGLQNRAWYYILDFYTLQGAEGTNYVTNGYLDGIARLVPGLNFSKWSSDRTSPPMMGQVGVDEQSAKTQGFDSTPTIVVQGPKGQAQPIVGAVPYSTLASSIKQVS